MSGEVGYAADAAAAAPAPRGEAIPGPGVRVLVVEDEAVVGDLIEEFLRIDGYEVDRAPDGREALQRVRGAAYGLIVSDIRMPDVDGPMLYRELVALDPGLARRVVFVTGDVLGEATRRFLDETGLGYLEKPFDLAAFRALARRVLDGS